MLSTKANEVLETLNADSVPMGKLKSIAKGIKRDHALAMELWSTEKYYPRLVAVLILDKNTLSLSVIETMMSDLAVHEETEALRISEWFLANQLTKSKKTIKLLESFQHHNQSILRRLFWYYQARLRWTGKTEFENTNRLVHDIESDLATEEPIVQWTMNMCAAWIGIFEPIYKDRLVALGEKVGLYKSEKVAKGCTPNYLPEFIKIESEKHK
ncbi:MAG: DNA alkylation repair protein [Tissierellales bacterium]|jgi:3-methyladenine DNA glycosylase AlkD|nr:DNA alkylation repair protein [Tissierellales bacterium]